MATMLVGQVSTLTGLDGSGWKPTSSKKDRAGPNGPALGGARRGAAGCGSAAAGRGGLRGDVRERVVGVRAEGRDGGDAHHDDEREHDGVLDRGRAVFLLQELNELLGHGVHGCLRWEQVWPGLPPAASTQP